MAAEKSHNLPSVNWRFRNADDIVYYKPKVLRTIRSNNVSPSPCINVQKTGVLTSKEGEDG
jgi:hypothetical protein